MQKVFIDSDVILDVFAKRYPFYTDSSVLLSLAEKKQIEAFTSPIVIANLNYILRKYKSKEFSLESLRKLRLFINIFPVKKEHVDKALSSKFNDFEDALQYFSALDQNVNFIITRNIGDYKPSKIPVCTPADFLQIYNVNL